jgi:Na+-transporting methylmalonyl-CoA/oxaloacetate decarboxylase gamma subunit
MEIKDALTITALGISVVFIGLILTSLMIRSFSFIHRLPRLFRKGEPEKEAEVKPAAVTVETDPDIIAIITAVLEVEFRKLSLLEGKFTFK